MKDKIDYRAEVLLAFPFAIEQAFYKYTTSIQDGFGIFDCDSQTTISGVYKTPEEAWESAYNLIDSRKKLIEETKQIKTL